MTPERKARSPAPDRGARANPGDLPRLRPNGARPRLGGQARQRARPRRRCARRSRNRSACSTELGRDGDRDCRDESRVVVRELFLAFLAQHDDGAWLRLVDRLETSIHPVDRAATRIWFHFFPLALQRAMERPERRRSRATHDAGGPNGGLPIKPTRRTVFLRPPATGSGFATPRSSMSTRPTRQAASISGRRCMRSRAAPRLRRPSMEPIVLGISAVALRTLQQVGPERLAGAAQPAPGAQSTDISRGRASATRRAGSSGLLGWLKGAGRVEVVFDEHRPEARFPLIPLAAPHDRGRARHPALARVRRMFRGPDSGAVSIVLLRHLLDWGPGRCGAAVGDGRPRTREAARSAA